VQHFGPPLRLGLSPLPLSAWLAPRPGDAQLLSLRRDIVSQYGRQVACERPEAGAATGEFVRRLVSLGRIEALPAPGSDVMAWLGQRLAEDLCVLTTDAADVYRLTAGAVCFANRWRLSEKIGTTMLATHAPVPRYADTVGSAVDRFCARLRPLRPYVRSNWGLVPTAALYTPDPTPPVALREIEAAYVRREDQSLIKLPKTGAVVFSIRTTLRPVAELGTAERADLAESVGALDAEWLRYKSITQPDGGAGI
jgi:hypothetical protein